MGLAKFRYSLQSILNIKLKMETQAKQDFSAAQNALWEEQERLEALERRKAEYERMAGKLRTGNLRIRDIEDNKNAILLMGQYIVEQQEQVAAAERRVEAAREALAEVMKERKTHETLKEKAFEAFLQEENKLESKAVDELTSYTYGRKKAGEA